MIQEIEINKNGDKLKWNLHRKYVTVCNVHDQYNQRTWKLNNGT